MVRLLSVAAPKHAVSPHSSLITHHSSLVTAFFAPVVQRIGHHATNVEIGIRVLAGVPFGRVRPIGSATSLLSWRYVGSNPTAPTPGSSNGKMCARLAQHRGSSPRPGTRVFRSILTGK